MGTGTHIRLDQRRTICARVRAMPSAEKPTWNTIVGIAKAVTGIDYTRQGLAKNDDIREAVDDQLAAYRRFREDGILTKSKVAEEDINPKDRQIASLRKRVDVLTETIRVYDERLVTLLGNAIAGGLTVEQLEQPRHRAPRHRTDVLESRKGK